MSKRVERFRHRRARLDKRVGDIPPPIADAELVQDILYQEIDWSLIDSVAIKMPVFNDVDVVVTDEDVDRCLSDLDSAFTRQKYDALFEGVKDTLIDQLLRPLNLSRSDLMEGDREFVYKDVKNQYRKGFDSTRKEVKKKATNSDGTTTDGFTDEHHGPNVKMEVDHVIPLKELHEQGGFMLNPEEKEALGNDPNNLVLTTQDNNRKKGDRRLEDQGFDGKQTRHTIKKTDSVKDQIPKGLDFAQRAAEDGVKTGNKQGQQQALAFLVSELIWTVFAEVKDVFENGWKRGDYNANWLESLRKRLNRVMRYLLNRWKGIAASFGTGWLSGFLSATITALLNMFVRTSKNMVRIIREGFVSIMKAIKVLLFPPEGMSLSQAAHEATKIFATGLVVTGGILAGEAIAGKLPMFGDILGPVLGGLISGLGSLFVVFMLDKLDLFGVNFDERHAFIMGTLEGRISEATREIEDIEAELERIIFAPPPTG